MRFVDLSHPFEDGMPGFRIKDEDGSYVTLSAKIRPFLTHKQTKPKYRGNVSFEITEILFQTSVGTYLDSPFHRYPNKRDIGELLLDEVILPGITIDVRGHNPFQSVSCKILPPNIDYYGKAVLFNFNWSIYWGKEQYYEYPFISEELISFLVDKKVKLVGVDTINVDNSRDLTRPAHSLFLKNDILIVENLTNLEFLHGKEYRFFAVPIKGKKAASMPVRAFAEVFD
ncbi:MAG: cyclase family protein [Promethearchaeota archaeon]